MKKSSQLLIVMLALIFALALCFGVLAACKHEHTFASKWSCDEVNHWHEATCGDTDEVSEKAAHSFKAGTEANTQVCEVCGYTKTIGGDDPSTPTDPSYLVDMDIPANEGTFEDYTLPRGEDEKQVIFYWREAEHSYADNDIWMWEIGGAEGRAFELHPCEYGAKAIINVPATIKRVGFIVRISTTHTATWGDASKVYEADREAILTGDVTEIYLTGKNQYQFTSTDGGKTLTMIKAITQMSIESFNEIKYGIVPSMKITDLSQVVVKCNGQPVEIESLSSLKKTAASGTIKLKNEVDLTKNYEVTIPGFDAQIATPIGVFNSTEFGNRYNYDGELGAILDSGSVIFKLWAPTASKVVLNLYENGNGAEEPQKINMVKGEQGVWSYTVENKDNAVGKYYTYSVTTSAGEQEAVDPYAKSAGVNGERGMIIDLNDTNPQDWNSASNAVVELNSYTDAIIWETHVRDFSNNIADSQYKGKYLAFTETGLTNSAGIPVGVDYLTDLGVTHIHLLPVFDYASVDEATASDENEAPQFNWGYDPKNYNVPEGSYSTDPYHGEVRVKEFKQMVQALHGQGLGVVMDVVYNHTYDKNSNLNKVVPNYYYRYNADGTNSSGSGCGNDTASERYMFSKYMVDSTTYWVKEYKLDGLRFDLMGLHDIETMQAIEKAVHEINPNAIIYGEGWTMTTAAKAGTRLATQVNIKRVPTSEGAAGPIAVFNDAIRDGLRGSVFNSEEMGYLNAATSSNRPKVEFGILGGEKSVSGSGASWTVKDAAVINYISAHDNHTLWDRLRTPYLDEDGIFDDNQITNDDLLAMNRLGATIVMLSKGTPFMTAGEEILRTKVNEDGTFNHNSYNASDEVNNLKWETLTEGSDELAMYNYYKGLIAMRKGLSFLRDKSVVVSTSSFNKSGIIVTYKVNDEIVGVAVINGTSKDYKYTLPEGNWALVCNGEQAGATAIGEVATGEVTVEYGVAHLYVNATLLA